MSGNIFQLLWEFFKTGLFSVGGGLATLPFLKEIAQRYDWFTVEDITDMLAVSESTPGPIGINMATYAGYSAYGLPGGILATLALISSSFVVIVLVSKVMERFQDNPLVDRIFRGIRPASIGLVAGAMYEVFVSTLFHTAAVRQGALAFFNGKAILFFAAAFLLLHKLPKLHPIVVILAGAACGVLFRF